MTDVTFMPWWWSWQAAGAIASTLAVLVALFGERIRKWFFGPKISVVEFPVSVPDQTDGLTKPVRFHHYLEIVNVGEPAEGVRIEILAVTFYPTKADKARLVRLPGVSIPMGSHLATRGSDELLRAREVFKLGQISSNELTPTLPISLEPRHNPLTSDDGDPHHRGRFHIQLVGRHFRSGIWSVDYVKDGMVTSGWRIEVIREEKEKQFWARIRNYAREYNVQKCKEGLP